MNPRKKQLSFIKIFKRLKGCMYTKRHIIIITINNLTSHPAGPYEKAGAGWNLSAMTSFTAVPV
jgi:hypothetical protein